MARGTIFKDKVITAVGEFGPSRRHDQIRGWITQAGGEYSSSLRSSTSHVVVAEETWKKQGATVQDALQRKGVHVVTYDWLEDCLVHSRKIKESKYLWEKISKDAVKKCLQKEKLAAKQKKQEEKKKKEKGTSTTRAFVGHLADYDDKKTKKKKAQAKLLKEPKAPAERKKRRTAEEKARDEATEKARRVVDREKAAGFQDLLSDNQHIYIDTTGFRYDIVLTKVDAVNNINERVQLKIYETNTDPASYATHMTISGTRREIDVHTVAAQGSNFPTAMRMFKNMFEETTGVMWDKRYSKFKYRPPPQARSASNNVRAGGFITERAVGRAGGVTQARVNKPISAAQRNAFDRERFKWKAPALDAPQGDLPLDAPHQEGAISNTVINLVDHNDTADHQNNQATTLASTASGANHADYMYMQGQDADRSEYAAMVGAEMHNDIGDMDFQGQGFDRFDGAAMRGADMHNDTGDEGTAATDTMDLEYNHENGINSIVDGLCDEVILDGQGDTQISSNNGAYDSGLAARSEMDPNIANFVAPVQPFGAADDDVFAGPFDSSEAEAGAMLNQWSADNLSNLMGVEIPTADEDEHFTYESSFQIQNATEGVADSTTNEAEHFTYEPTVHINTTEGAMAESTTNDDKLSTDKPIYQTQSTTEGEVADELKEEVSAEGGEHAETLVWNGTRIQKK